MSDEVPEVLEKYEAKLQVFFQHFTEGAEFMYQETFITVLGKFGLVRDDILPPSSALRVFKSGARSRDDDGNKCCDATDFVDCLERASLMAF
eukprot:CAMPEP_0180183150 /NCGR_PEP_ID=MMETSP0986-20121125/41056_1 /TAXON_ID=697907 /ORGANISM="non described non described, Strain CCMP2293" /LENGTH=91 /DNA_ID=CAMNT_0022136587 /DNA_START=6 /DNA_END=278 /DNA_ORIENTATION=+